MQYIENETDPYIMNYHSHSLRYANENNYRKNRMNADIVNNEHKKKIISNLGTY